KLFVGSGGRPRILDYSGRGKLRFWFRVAAGRNLLDDVRKKTPLGSAAKDEALLDLPSSEADPEILHMKPLDRHEFNLAFEEAARALTPEDRNALRSYYAHGMSIDEIAAAFGVHRATAARRVNRAREKLLSDTQRRLAARLALSQRELDSIMR